MLGLKVTTRLSTCTARLFQLEIQNDPTVVILRTASIKISTSDQSEQMEPLQYELLQLGFWLLTKGPIRLPWTLQTSSNIQGSSSYGSTVLTASQRHFTLKNLKTNGGRIFSRCLLEATSAASSSEALLTCSFEPRWINELWRSRTLGPTQLLNNQIY